MQTDLMGKSNCLQTEHKAESVAPIGKRQTIPQRSTWDGENPSILGVEDTSGQSK